MGEFFASVFAVLFWSGVAAVAVIVAAGVGLEIARLVRSLRENRAQQPVDADEHATDFEAWARELEEHTS